jgi:hypothetical protein
MLKESCFGALETDVVTGARSGAVVWWEEERKRTERKLRREQTTAASTKPTRVILRTLPIPLTWRIQTTCYRMRKRI